MIDRGLIRALTAVEVVDLGLVAELIASFEPDRIDRVRLSELVDLTARLPSGLVHAEAIWALADRPVDMDPLAEGSAWSAMDRSLVVEVPRTGGDLAELLLDLGRYYLAARVVRARLEARVEILEALEAGAPSGAVSAELAVMFEAAASDVEALPARAPQLMADLAWMAKRAFEPTVHLHDDVRADRQRARGERIAEALISNLPQGDLFLFLSDQTIGVELVSPYVRDLGHALYRWGIENPTRLSTFGLAEALIEGERAPEPDLAALVVDDLFRAAPDLLDERRSNEAVQGLHLEQDRSTLYGLAALPRLAAPDRLSVPADATGTLGLVCSSSPEVLAGALPPLLETRRVAGLSNVFAAGVQRDVVVPGRVSTVDDGFRLAGAPRLWERAAEIGIEVHPADRIDDGPRGVPDVLIRLLRGTRRARVIGALSDGAPVFSVLSARIFGGVTPTIRGRMSGLLASRLALSALLTAPSRDHTRSPKTLKSKGKKSFPRRFRA